MMDKASWTPGSMTNTTITSIICIGNIYIYLKRESNLNFLLCGVTPPYERSEDFFGFEVKLNMYYSFKVFPANPKNKFMNLFDYDHALGKVMQLGFL